MPGIKNRLASKQNAWSVTERARFWRDLDDGRTIYECLSRYTRTEGSLRREAQNWMRATGKKITQTPKTRSVSAERVYFNFKPMRPDYAVEDGIWSASERFLADWDRVYDFGMMPEVPAHLMEPSA